MSRSFVDRGGFMSESSDGEEDMPEEVAEVGGDAKASNKEGSSEESFASAEEPSSRSSTPSEPNSLLNITPPKSSPSPLSKSTLSRSPVKSNSSPKATGDDSIVQLTPPKSSPSPSHKPKPKTSMPRKRWEDEDDPVITVSSSEEEDEFNEAAVEESVNMPKPLVTNSWNQMEVREAESKVDKLAKNISANKGLLNSGGLRLPDGGASLRRTIEEDTRELGKLEEDN